VEWTWESEEQKCQKDLGTGFRSSWGHFTGYPGSFLSPPSPHKERHDARRGRESHARMLCRVGGGMQTPCALLSFESHPCLTPGVYIREAAPISVKPPGRGVRQVQRRGTRAQNENEHDHTSPSRTARRRQSFPGVVILLPLNSRFSTLGLVGDTPPSQPSHKPPLASPLCQVDAPRAFVSTQSPH